MPRFFISSLNRAGNTVTLSDKEQVHYIKDVLRLKLNEKAVIFDEKRNEYACAVKDLLKDKIIFKIQEKRSAVRKDEIKITIACALPKKAKIDEIIDKLTQLGVKRIIPMLTARVIVKLDQDKAAKQLARWQKIAQAAAEQSQRNDLPVIEPLQNIEEILARTSDYDLKLIPHLEGERKTLKEVIAGKNPKSILVLIGPEGDFTDEEVALAKKAGCAPVSLGDTVLRVDTAAVAAASFIKLYEDH